MTKLRELMIRDMTLRGFAPNTQRTYLQAVSQLAEHYGRSPDRISNREVKGYLFHLHQNKKRSTSTCNVASAALRFLYHQMLGRSHANFEIPIARVPKKLPQVLCRDEVRGADEDDILIVEFDLVHSTAVLRLGDDEMLEEWSPSY